MNRFEAQLYDQLNDVRRRRLTALLTHREELARNIVQLQCWGLAEVDALDRQLGLVEDAVLQLVTSPRLRRQLTTSWVEADAALIHPPGQPGDFDCSTCRNDGTLALEDLLARVPD